MMHMRCPSCNTELPDSAAPRPTVDIIIEAEGGIVFIKRKNPPHGWAFPGGFVDPGESFEEAAVREALEETGLVVTLQGQLHTYSDPRRDRRLHTASTVFVAQARGRPNAGDDAAQARIFSPDMPSPLVFDHGRMLADYLRWKKSPWPLF